MERTREEILHELCEIYTNAASDIALKEEYYKHTYEYFSDTSFTDSDLSNLIGLYND